MKKWITALLAGAMALGPVAALAAIDNTHHDMPWMVPTLQAGERCTFCHSKVGISSQDPLLGKVGNFCVAVCHLNAGGISGSDGYAVPTSPGMFTWTAGSGFTIVGGGSAGAAKEILTMGHGMNKATLNGFDSAEATSTGNTGWPYTTGNQLQCTSCHTVHDADNPPFLNAKLTDGTQTGGFCQRCHTDTIRQTTFASQMENHPIEFPWNPTAAQTRFGTAKDGGIMNNRRLLIGSGLNNVILNVVATGVDSANTDPKALNGKAAHWNLGGHVLRQSTALPQDGTTGTAGNDLVSCVACHTVHENGSATNPLANVLTAGNSIITVCLGCHTTDPGRTTYNHPIGPYDIPMNKNAAVNWSVAVPLAPAYTGLNGMYRPTPYSGNAPYCVSCHDVHGGHANRMAIRQISALNANGAACEMCHLSSYGNPTAANQHHPGAVTTNYNTAFQFPQQAGWTTTDGLGSLEHGLSCPDCHVGDGSTTKRATAHNWQ